MLIKEIFEFELRGPEHFSRTYTLTIGYFHGKTKISKENLREDYFMKTTKYEAIGE